MFLSCQIFMFVLFLPWVLKLQWLNEYWVPSAHLGDAVFHCPRHKWDIQPLLSRWKSWFFLEGEWPTTFYLWSVMFCGFSTIFLSYRQNITMKKSNYEEGKVVATLQAGPSLDHIKFILLCLHIYNRGFPLVLFSDMSCILSHNSLPVSKSCQKLVCKYLFWMLKCSKNGRCNC